MKIVVTGALGHIGSQLIRDLPQLMDDPLEIVMIDNFRCQRYPSLFNLPSKPGLKYLFVEKDVAKEDIDQYLINADVLIHLAAITDAANSFYIKDQVELNNFQSTLRTAQACLRLGVRYVFLSTTSVYGTQANQVDESCSKDELKPQSPYAETKLKEEQFLLEVTGLKFVIARFGTICGTSPGMRFHTAVNKFCWQASLGLPITVWKTALHQNRPYLVLNDAIEFISFVIKKDLFDRQVYNVVSENTSVQKIIDCIQECIPDVKMNMVDNAVMNQLSYHVLDNKIRQQGFSSEGSIKGAIQDTLKLLETINKHVVKKNIIAQTI